MKMKNDVVSAKAAQPANNEGSEKRKCGGGVKRRRQLAAAKAGSEIKKLV
jgi:hypothetical protein